MALLESWLSSTGTNLAGILHIGSIVKHTVSVLIIQTGGSALAQYWHRTIGLSMRGFTMHCVQGIRSFGESISILFCSTSNFLCEYDERVSRKRLTYVSSLCSPPSFEHIKTHYRQGNLHRPGLFSDFPISSGTISNRSRPL
jgi:hypothetical protein